MGDQQEETEGLYVQHQYMCSECHQLFNTLEEVLVHQQSHTGPDGEAEEGESVVAQADTADVQQESQYQCLECGALLRTPEELLLHQELHMREAGMETEQHELCEVVESSESMTVPQVSGQIQYQCLECLALFDTPEVWLAHRQTHSKSSTQNTLSDTEYVLQADGSVTPLVNVQNLVVSEQRAGEILTLAQVLAAQQQTTPLPQATPQRGGSLLPSLTPLPGSATLRLQICTAQALADGSTGPGLRRAKLLPPLLPLDSAAGAAAGGKAADTQRSFQVGSGKEAEGEAGEGGGGGAGEVVIIHPYECSECALLFQTPEDFLQHQGEHFLGQDKESVEEGVMEGEEEEEEMEEEEVRPEENGSMEDEDRHRPHGNTAGPTHRRQHSAFLPPRPRQQAPPPATPPISLQCGECQRTFTSANRLSAHRRVHEHGTHECPECDKVFKKPASLQTHMRTHSGEARYLCVDCGHGFTTEMTLIIHRKSHTAEPLHRCQFCAKTFTNMTKFLYHRRTHTARAPLAPITMVSAASQRLPVSHLSILQRAKEREEASLREREVAMETVGTTFTLPGEPVAEPHSAPGGAEAGTAGSAVGGVENGLDRNAEHVPTTETLGGDGNPVVDAGSSATPVAAAELGADQTASLAGSSGSVVASPAPARTPPFACPSCGKVFTSQLCLLRHRRSVHATERRFKCGVCGKPFKKQIHVRNHLRVHTGERPFQCSDCGKTFSSLANLSRHGLTHSGLRPYRCDLAAHRYVQHPGAPAPYPCPHCSAGFLRKRQRDRHCLETHPEAAHADGLTADPLLAPLAAGSEAPPPETATGNGDSSGVGSSLTAAQQLRPGLECNVCGKRLNSAANLRLHQLSHGRRRPGGLQPPGATRGKGHQCPVCGKLFVSSSGVVLHQRVHTGERPFPCGQCGKRFRQNTHLREHLRTHSGERPFRCEMCGKGFVQSMHLAEHRRTHTGERPHACSVCGKAFKTFSNLRSHRKTHARALRQEQAAGGGAGGAVGGGAVTVVDASTIDLSGAVPTVCQQGELGQPQLIQIQTPQGQGTPTIMCNEFGETIAIIETSEGGALPLAEAIEIYHTALENTLGMDSITVDSLQLL
ncbi:hypothetical protein AGOR_G00211950 [Albula goreensis]|uniref:C2H2-type domain-containing protein n=1 Tax=Albula goreensis TaxID=1534307 RepID=A0A8T3CR13_9TELE|nr:hypothetical protein AGOR_G00211950 [Albula goreensis]